MAKEMKFKKQISIIDRHSITFLECHLMQLKDNNGADPFYCGCIVPWNPIESLIKSQLQLFCHYYAPLEALHQP